jgi:hypothetical protein
MSSYYDNMQAGSSSHLSKVLALAGALTFVPQVSSVAEAGTDDAESAETTTHVAAETGFERLDRDYYLNLVGKIGLGFEVPKIGCDGSQAGDCQTNLRARLQAPLRLRVLDRGSSDGGLWRRRDWDEPGDYLKFLRRLEYGSSSEAAHVRLGELGSVVLGHGTTVNHYFNSVTPDHYRLGLQASYEGDQAGGEVLVSDLVRPELFAGRVYVRPATFVHGANWWRRLSVGASLVTDVTAPSRLQRSGTKRPLVGPTRRPEVGSGRATAIGGLDIELQAVRTDQVGVTPYADFNHHFGLGRGLHTGVDLKVAPGDRLAINSRLEYRLLGNRYLPDYVGPLYEIDRYQLSGWGALLPEPKLKIAAGLDDGPRHGIYGELEANVGDMVTMSGAMAQHEGTANGWARLGLQASILDRGRIGAFYYRHGFDAVSNMFDSDGAFFVAESRVTIWGPLYAKGAYSRLWKLYDDGLYEPVDRWSIGTGVSFSL